TGKAREVPRPASPRPNVRSPALRPPLRAGQGIGRRVAALEVAERTHRAVDVVDRDHGQALVAVGVCLGVVAARHGEPLGAGALARTTRSATLSPGRWARMSAIASPANFTCFPSTATMTSFARSTDAAG